MADDNPPAVATGTVADVSSSGQQRTPSGPDALYVYIAIVVGAALALSTGQLLRSLGVRAAWTS